MAHILCKLIGHREYGDEVLQFRPWEDPDFVEYSQQDFRETNCLRCGELLLSAVA